MAATARLSPRETARRMKMRGVPNESLDR
jgi:hypothetical protein